MSKITLHSGQHETQVLSTSKRRVPRRRKGMKTGREQEGLSASDSGTCPAHAHKPHAHKPHAHERCSKYSGLRWGPDSPNSDLRLLNTGTSVCAGPDKTDETRFLSCHGSTPFQKTGSSSNPVSAHSSSLSTLPMSH